MEDCVFCKIVKSELPCVKIWEDENFLAFLDAFPAIKGQVLLIPKKHIAPYLFDVEEKIYCDLLLIAKRIAKAMDKALVPIKTGLIIEGLEVDHVHVKLFPLKEGFSLKPLEPKLSEGEMKEIANKIKYALR